MNRSFRHIVHLTENEGTLDPKTKVVYDPKDGVEKSLRQRVYFTAVAF